MKSSFQRSLAIWFSLAIAIMIGVAGVIYSSFAQTIALDAWVVHTRDIIDLLEDISTAERDMQIGSRSYVITGDTSFLDSFSVGKARIAPLMEKLAKTIRDNPIQLTRAQQLQARLLERIDSTLSLIALYNKSGFDRARSLIVTRHGLEVSDDFRELLMEMKAEEERLLVERTQNVTDARVRALVIGGIGALLSLVIIGLVFWLVRREGMRRLTAEAGLSGANQRLSSSLQQAERLIQEKRMIDRVAGLLHSCSTLDAAREIIGKEVRQALPDLRGAVYLYRSSRNLVEAISHWNEPHALMHKKSFLPEECWALKSGSQHLMRTRDDVACGHVDTNVTEATVCVPMNIHGESIGIMLVEGSKNQFDDARLDLIRRLVDQIGMSLATLRFQQQLRDQSFRDPLTGLFNRRYLETTIEKDVSRADRHHQTIGLVMIDIDHFKLTNDRYGHDAGDIILKSVSETLRSHTRTEDIACRYGGEEFLLVFPGASLTVTCERAETLRQAVEKIAAGLKDGTTITGNTISLGVAAYPMHGSSWQGAVRLADQALYRAKDQGRNRVVVADAVPVGKTQLPEIEESGS